MPPEPKESVDRLLRRHGFRIHARPTKGPATWERHGKVFYETVAVKIARRLETGLKEQAE